MTASEADVACLLCFPFECGEGADLTHVEQCAICQCGQGVAPHPILGLEPLVPSLLKHACLNPFSGSYETLKALM